MTREYCMIGGGGGKGGVQCWYIPYQTASRWCMEVEKWSWFEFFFAWKVHRGWEEQERVFFLGGGGTVICKPFDMLQ